MATQHIHEPSHLGDSDSFRKWMPIVVPLAAVMLAALVVLIAAEVLWHP
jgi:hypothetical protein